MKKIIAYVFILLLCLFIFLSIQFVNGYFSDRVNTYIENKGTVYTQNYLEQALRESVVNNIDIDSMYYIHKNEDEVKQVLINTSQINLILQKVNETLDNAIVKLDDEVLSLPLGIILGETIFSSIGPNIELKVYPVGSYTCDVLSSIQEYGINNSLFEIYIQVIIKIETIIPLRSSVQEVECHIPLVMQILQGDVPRYYYNTDNLVPDVYDN